LTPDVGFFFSNLRCVESAYSILFRSPLLGKCVLQYIFLSSILTPIKCALFFFPLCQHLDSVHCIFLHYYYARQCVLYFSNTLHSLYSWKVCTVFLSTLLALGKCVLYLSPFSLHLDSVFCISLRSTYTRKVCTLFISNFY
jgi:hypothetical protein